jgi:hypothetical protein
MERNQSKCVLSIFVQGRRFLHPTDEDLSVGTPTLLVASRLSAITKPHCIHRLNVRRCWP